MLDWTVDVPCLCGSSNFYWLLHVHVLLSLANDPVMAVRPPTPAPPFLATSAATYHGHLTLSE